MRWTIEYINLLCMQERHSATRHMTWNIIVLKMYAFAGKNMHRLWS